MPRYLPSPTHVFTIPSIYDGIKLACRLYLPQQLLDTRTPSQWRVQGAIVAHPYASLGGCYDDPVVSFIGGELLDAGYVVGTFNFRYSISQQRSLNLQVMLTYVLEVLVIRKAVLAGRRSLSWRTMSLFMGS
jgi:hypothetical protein